MQGEVEVVRHTAKRFRHFRQGTGSYGENDRQPQLSGCMGTGNVVGMDAQLEVGRVVRLIERRLKLKQVRGRFVFFCRASSKKGMRG